MSAPSTRGRPRATILGAALALVWVPSAAPCSGPPPLDLTLQVTASEGRTLSCALRPPGPGGDDPLATFAGVPVEGCGDRLVRLDGAAARQTGAPFSISPLGPTPSMLLQWGGFEAARPEAPGRRRGYTVEVHASEATGLPPPPGWSGPWDPSQERWYQAPARLTEDRAAVRWMHRDIGARVGEESEPWLKLEHDEDGVPARLHLWVVLGGEFSDPSDLWLRLEPARAESVRVTWDWGDGTTSSKLAGAPGAPLLERLVATHRYENPGEYQARARVELDWLYGSWATEGEPWDWSIQVAYIGAVDLSSLRAPLAGDTGDELTRRVAAVRSRLRCLPGDQAASGLPGAAPCTYQEAEEPDRFLDPAGDAITALLEAVLPPSLREHASRLPVTGTGDTLSLRFRFSGSFPHHSAPLDAAEATRQALGPSPSTVVHVPEKSE